VSCHPPPHHIAACACLLTAIAIAPVPDVQANDEETFIQVRHRQRLPADTIACERVPLGEVDDYKPSIVLLPDGQLLLTMFSGRRLESGKIAEQAVIYRSDDGGRTWSERETPDIAGREPALSVTKSGVVFITAHLLGQDVRNKDGYTHSYLHRSADGGRTWTSRRVEPDRFRARTIGLTSRNVLQLADGSLLYGISEHAPRCASVVLRSRDDGKTWTSHGAVFDKVPENYPYTLFGEAHLWQAQSGKLFAILRVGAGNSWPIDGTRDPGNNDQSERMIVYSSTDGGRRWRKVTDLGVYGQMYMSLLRPADGQLLLTYTQRAVHPPLGVRAALGAEHRDGFSFDLKHDEIMIETKTPAGVSSGGGFGPTVQLADGALVTAYTYRDAENKKHAEIVRWRLPKLN
ncbi:MAG: sialidase family protein, partial [Pirellulaceae bacterium]|nr:sialidase family protein [Pirellulaceae bacterium]